MTNMAYLATLHEIELLAAFPFTVTTPEFGVELYPRITWTWYWYVPFGSFTVMVLPVDVRLVPLNVTAHAVPVGSPVSENVTRNSTSVKVTG